MPWLNPRTATVLSTDMNACPLTAQTVVGMCVDGTNNVRLNSIASLVGTTTGMPEGLFVSRAFSPLRTPCQDLGPEVD